MEFRKIYGPKRKELAGSWRRLHNEEFHSLYASLNISRRMRWDSHIARIGEVRHTKFW